MKKSFVLIATMTAALFAGTAAHAQQTAAPAGSTGQCKDGSYTSNATKRGSCSGHKGVKEWYGTPASAPASTPAATQAAAPAPTAAPTANTTVPTSTANPRPFNKVPTTAAPGGGAGRVWANDSSKVYHCPSDRWYGKTKHGEYLSEAEAKAKGFRPDHGKACTP